MSNPAFSITNLKTRVKPKDNYLLFGVDDDYGIISSDTPSGIVIKRGGLHGKDNNEVNANQGKGLVYIAPEGKLGIQTNRPPEDYDADVNGHVRSLTAYLETNSKTIEKCGDLKDDEQGKTILDKVMGLKPIRFNWLVENLKEEGEQIGFMAQNVNNEFPELVKKTGRDDKSIAYGNLTAVLVKAIQDQQKMIGDLTDRVCELEQRLGIGD